MVEVIRVGLDTSKQSFQVYGVDRSERMTVCRQMSRAQVEKFFAALAPTVVGLEACGASHYWARVLRELGHDVRLLPPQYVKPYVKRGKNDRIDAEAICEAMSRPSMRFVPVKSAAEQAAMLLSVRDLLIKQRTMLANAIRGHAAEFGVIGAKGVGRIADLLARARESVPKLALTSWRCWLGSWRCWRSSSASLRSSCGLGIGRASAVSGWRRCPASGR